MRRNTSRAIAPSKEQEAPSLRRELDLLTHNEVCEVLGLAIGTGHNRASRGDWPPSIKVGRRSLYPLAGLKRWLASRPSR